MTDDRGQTVVCRCAARSRRLRGKAATKFPPSVFRPLSSGRGFTLVELLIVISLVGILASVFFSRVLYYQELAEKAAMQQVVSALQTGLSMQYGHRLASGMGEGKISIVTENPMNWLAQKPGNYAGEFDSVNPSEIEPGNWAFDLNTRELIYLPYHTEYFVPQTKAVRWIRYRAKFVYEASYRNKGTKELAGVIFSPVEPYQWVIRENK